MSDWIKIHRGILDSYAFANPVSLKIWVWMLLKANYKASFVPLKVGLGVSSIKVERGQFIFGRIKAEEELSISGSTIYRQMQKFEDLGQIKIDVNSTFSIVTVCNYDTYQSKKDNSEQQLNSNRTAIEQQLNNDRTPIEHIKEELESKEEIELIQPIVEILDNGTWESEKRQFLISEQWQMKQCTEFGLTKALLLVQMNEFLKELEIKDDFKDLKELKRHWYHWYKKKGTSPVKFEMSDYQKNLLQQREAAKKRTA